MFLINPFKTNLLVAIFNTLLFNQAERLCTLVDARVKRCKQPIKREYFWIRLIGYPTIVGDSWGITLMFLLKTLCYNGNNIEQF